MKPTCKPWSEPWSEASVVVLPRWFVALVWTSLVFITLTSLKAIRLNRLRRTSRLHQLLFQQTLDQSSEFSLKILIQIRIWGLFWWIFDDGRPPIHQDSMVHNHVSISMESF